MSPLFCATNAHFLVHTQSKGLIFFFFSVLHTYTVFNPSLRYLKLIDWKPCCPVWGILSEAHVFKEFVGDNVLLLYEAVHWGSLSVESLGHGTDQDFSVAFPSVLWQSVQHPHGTGHICQDPGHGLCVCIQHTAGGVACKHVPDHPDGLIALCKLPRLIHNANVWFIQRAEWDPWADAEQRGILLYKWTNTR